MVHVPRPPGAGQEPLVRPLTRSDLVALLVDTRTALADADAVVQDTFRPPRERELGHVLRVQNYTDAHASVARALDVLLAHFSAPEPADAVRDP